MCEVSCSDEMNSIRIYKVMAINGKSTLNRVMLLLTAPPVVGAGERVAAGPVDGASTTVRVLSNGHDCEYPFAK